MIKPKLHPYRKFAASAGKSFKKRSRSKEAFRALPESMIFIYMYFLFDGEKRRLKPF